MDEPTKTNPEKTALSRRELLKTLAAAGGALGASAFLPGKWIKPMVEAGVLPVHAQGTLSDLTISDLSVWPMQNQTAPTPPMMYQGEFKYHDPMQQVSQSAAKLHGKAAPCGNTVPTSLGFVSPENALEGWVGFTFGGEYLCVNATKSEYCVKLEATGRVSNELCAPITNLTSIFK